MGCDGILLLCVFVPQKLARVGNFVSIIGKQLYYLNLWLDVKKKKRAKFVDSILFLRHLNKCLLAGISQSMV